MEESSLTSSRGGCRWDWGSAYRATNNGRRLAAAGRHAVPLRRLRKDFEAIGDGGGFAEHGGYGAVLCLRSASKGTTWPEGMVARNSSRAIHFTVAVCMAGLPV